MSPYQQEAERLAQESVSRLGFVVVHFRHEGLPFIGKRTKILWRMFTMPVPFIVVRQATEEEVSAQVRLFREVTGREPAGTAYGSVPFVLVTD